MKFNIFCIVTLAGLLYKIRAGGSYESTNSPSIKAQGEISNHEEPIEVLSSNPPKILSPKTKQIDKNKQIIEILRDVEEEFRLRKQSKLSHSNNYFIKNARKSLYGIKNKWSRYKYGYGETQRILSLPKYMTDIESKLEQENIEAMGQILETAYELNLNQDSVYVQESDEPCDSYEEEDLEDEDCDKKLIRKYCKKLCERLDEKQKEIIKGLIHALHEVNHGSVAALHEFCNCLLLLEEDLFEIFQEILMIIDKLTAIGVDAIKLIIEALIDLLGSALKAYEEQKCGCDCPNLIHSIIKWLIDIITWTPKKLLKQLIEHIIDIITSAPWFRCTCACEGIFAVSIPDYTNGTINDQPINDQLNTSYPGIYFDERSMVPLKKRAADEEEMEYLGDTDDQEAIEEDLAESTFEDDLVENTVEEDSTNEEGLVETAGKKVSGARHQLNTPLLSKLDSFVQNKLSDRKVKQISDNEAFELDQSQPLEEQRANKNRFTKFKQFKNQDEPAEMNFDEYPKKKVFSPNRKAKSERQIDYGIDDDYEVDEYGFGNKDSKYTNGYRGSQDSSRTSESLRNYESRYSPQESYSETSEEEYPSYKNPQNYPSKNLQTKKFKSPKQGPRKENLYQSDYNRNY